MPDRTLKELMQIRKEVDLIKEIWDKYEGDAVYFNPFHDYETRRKEVLDFLVPITNQLNELKESNQIQTCEGEKLISILIEGLRNSKVGRFSNHIKYSSFTRPSGGFSLDRICNELEAQPFNDGINEELDRIKGYGCEPVAIDEKLIEEAKALAFDSNNITLSENQKKISKSISHII